MSTSYRVALAVVRLLVRLFFRRVEVSGTDRLPAGGGILVAWHPNGLIDPALIVSPLGRRVVFGARHGLFRWPLLGRLMRSMGTVPLYRAIDLERMKQDRRRAANRTSLDGLAEEIADGAFAALFPEGVSHDSPDIQELKTGIARLYYRARQLAGPDAPPPAIVPVGLHYDKKRSFRSSALVEFHTPLALPAELDVVPDPDEADEIRRERYRGLTDLIEQALVEVTHATEDWELHHLMHRARKLVRAELAQRAGIDHGPPDMRERQLGFARIWAAYRQRRESHPGLVAGLRRRLAGYEADLLALRLEDHELDRDPRRGSPWLAALLVLQILGVYVLLPPLLILGYLINLPAALVVMAVSRSMSSAPKDEASLKLLAGAVLFPLAWLSAGLLAARGYLEWHRMIPTIPDTPLLAGLATALLGMTGGVVALRYGRLSRETLHAMRVRLTRRRRWVRVARLRVERREIYDGLTALAEGLDLPGRVTEDGRIVPES